MSGLRSARWLAGTGLLLAIGAAAWRLAPAAVAGDEALWASVTVDDLVMSVEISGTLTSEQSLFLGPIAVPRIWDYKISFLVDEGSEVREGDRVLAFDTTELERRHIDEQQRHEQAAEQLEKTLVTHRIDEGSDAMQIAEAEAKLRRAALAIEVPAELAAAQELRKSHLQRHLAETELRHVRELTAARRRGREAAVGLLTQARDRAAGRVEEIRTSITRMTVTAPSGGTVIHLSERGQPKKKVGDQCWRGEKVIEIPDLSRMKAEGEIDEADAGKVQPGQGVRFRLEAHPDFEIRGTVRSIRRTVGERSGSDPSKVVGVEVALDAADTTRMRPGMRFRGTVETERIPGLLLVPAEAVFPAPGGPIAWRRRWRSAEPIAVELGRRSASAVEVLSGLSAGDRVATVDLRTPGGTT